MTFQEGNQYGVGYGRPPKYYSEEQVHEIGKEMIDWLEANKDDFWGISDFYYGVKKMHKKDWDLLKERKSFASYYETALEIMTLCVMRNRELAQSYGNRFLAMYSRDLKSHERSINREKIEDEIALKKADAVGFTSDQVILNKAILDGITALQKDLASRSTANSNRSESSEPS